MATNTIAGAMTVAAAFLLVVAAQPPAAAPGPYVSTPAGAPGPYVSTPAGAPGPYVLTPAGAPGPAGLDCFTYLVNMSDCLSYVEAGGNATTPDKGCCPELAGLVESQPICLCQLLGTNTSGSLGIQIDLSKALKLPSVCGVETPPVSLCSAAGYPVGVPMPSEAPSAPGGIITPASGNNDNGGASGIAVSQLSNILVGLAVAFLTTHLF